MLYKESKMEILRQQHNQLLSRLDTQFERYLMHELPWNDRLLGIKGARGTGKTTLLLQYIKKRYGLSQEALYVSLDNLYFADNRLFDLVDEFHAMGGEHIFIDEVHKYPDWALEFKNIYDAYPELKVTFTGSSLLHILDSRADLSRRSLIFEMKGLSFREYLNFVTDYHFEVQDLEMVLNNHVDIALDISKKLKPLKYFNEYLQWGYYPFFRDDKTYFYRRLQEVVNMIIEIELPMLRNVDPSKTLKIKQLLYIIALSSPFKPNISKLAAKIGITRNTLNEYIKILADARLINILTKNAVGINLLQKPDKIFLENTTLAFAISGGTPDKGNLRETFFLNQLSKGHTVTYPQKADFLIDGKYLFEVGGKDKNVRQIGGLENAFIAADDILAGFENKIPLWLFGFLY